MALSKEHINNVCKMGQGENCCRYLTYGVRGFECEKTTALKGVIDSRVDYMTAKADNCEGVRNEK